MRLALLWIFVARAASADPLWEAELRLGYGLAVGGQGAMATRTSPLTITATGSVAVNEQPAITAYGGLVAETLDRSSVGTTFGARITPEQTPLRLTAGGVWIFAPYTLWGAVAGAGTCKTIARHLRACGDLQLTSYFAGTDLAPDRTVMQVELVFGIVVDGP